MPVYAGERIERHAEFAQQPCRGHHLVEGRGTALVDAKPVMQFARTVDAEPDKEAVLLEKSRPFLVEENAVGLQVVFDALIGLCVFFLQRDHAPIKI